MSVVIECDKCGCREKAIVTDNVIQVDIKSVCPTDIAEGNRILCGKCYEEYMQRRSAIVLAVKSRLLKWIDER